jgi:hypothetical protein
MKGKKNLPDLVVFNEETQRYDAFLKKYPTSVSSPKIEVSDLSLFKQRAALHTNHKFNKRAEEIRQQIDILLREFEDNELVWGSVMSFEPQIGSEIYLYENNNGKRFASLISPDEWKNDFIYFGNFKLDTDFSWKRI